MSSQQTHTIKMQFVADTSAAQRSLQTLAQTLNNITAIDSTKTGFGLTTKMQGAIESAKTLQNVLQSAVNVDTGKLNLNQFMSGLSKAGTSVAALSSSLAGAGSLGTQAFTQLASAVARAEAPMRQMNATLAGMMTTLANTVKWQLSSSAIHGLMSGFSSAVGYVKDLNSSLNNIRIVTGQSVDDMARFALKANEAAKALSTTTNAYAKASLIYYQQGDSAAEAARKAEITLKAANASFNTSAEQMSEYLTAVWNSYQVGADELERYVDIMAALGAKTATSLEEIATSMQKVAATANTVGVSMEEVSSIISTVSSVTRESAESIGTSFKTIFARIGDLKLGETLEDGVGLGQVSSALKKINVDILDSAGNMREMGDIITDLGNRWQTLSQAQKTATAQVVAGKRQYTQLMALFENWDQYNKSLNIAQNAEGELQNQANIYATSWEGASNRVRAAWEGVWGQLFKDEALIKMTNTLADIVNGVGNVVKGFGGLQGVLVTVGNVMLSMFKNQLATNIDNAIMKIHDFKASFEGLSKGDAFKSFFTQSTYQRNTKRVTAQLNAGLDTAKDQGQRRLDAMRAHGTEPSKALKDETYMLGEQYTATQRLLRAKNELVAMGPRLSQANQQVAQQAIENIDKEIQKMEDLKRVTSEARQERNTATSAASGTAAAQRYVQGHGLQNATDERAQALYNRKANQAMTTGFGQQFFSEQGNREGTQVAANIGGGAQGAVTAFADQTAVAQAYDEVLKEIEATEQKLQQVQGDSAKAMKQRNAIIQESQSKLKGMANAARQMGFDRVADQITIMADKLSRTNGVTDAAAQATNNWAASSGIAQNMMRILARELGITEQELNDIAAAAQRGSHGMIQLGAGAENTAGIWDRLSNSLQKNKLSIGQAITTITSQIMAAAQGFNAMKSFATSLDDANIGSILTSIGSAAMTMGQTIKTSLDLWGGHPIMAVILLVIQGAMLLAGFLSGQAEKAREEKRKNDESARKASTEQAAALKEEVNAVKELTTNFNTLLNQKRQGLDVDEELKNAAMELAAKYNITGAALNSLQGDYEEFVKAVQSNALEGQISQAEAAVATARGVIQNNSALSDDKGAGGSFFDFGYNSDHYGAAVRAGYGGVDGGNVWSLWTNNAVITQELGEKISWTGKTGKKSNRDWFKEVGLENSIIKDEGNIELLLSSKDTAEYKLDVYNKLEKLYANLSEAGEGGSDLGIQITSLLDTMEEEMAAYESAVESLGELRIAIHANEWAGKTYESTKAGAQAFAEDYEKTYLQIAEEIKNRYMEMNQITDQNIANWSEEQRNEYQAQINSAMQAVVGSNAAIAGHFSAITTLFNTYESNLYQATNAFEKIVTSFTEHKTKLTVDDIDADMAEMYQLTGGQGAQWSSYLISRNSNMILETLQQMTTALEELTLSDDMSYDEMKEFFTSYKAIREELYEKFGIQLKTFDELMMMPYEERMAYITAVQANSGELLLKAAQDNAANARAQVDAYWTTNGTEQALIYNSEVGRNIFTGLTMPASLQGTMTRKHTGETRNSIYDWTEADWLAYEGYVNRQTELDSTMLGYLFKTDTSGNTVVNKSGVKIDRNKGIIVNGEVIEGSLEWLSTATGKAIANDWTNDTVNSLYNDSDARLNAAHGYALARTFNFGQQGPTEDEIAAVRGAHGRFTTYKGKAKDALTTNEAAQEELAITQALVDQQESVIKSVERFTKAISSLPTTLDDFTKVAEAFGLTLSELASSTAEERAKLFIANKNAIMPQESDFAIKTYKHLGTGETISEAEYNLLNMLEQGTYTEVVDTNWAEYANARANWVKGMQTAMSLVTQEDLDNISKYTTALQSLTQSYQLFVQTGKMDDKTAKTLLSLGIDPNTIQTIEDYEAAIHSLNTEAQNSADNLQATIQNATDDLEVEIDWSKMVVGTTWVEFVAAQSEEVQKYLLSDEGSWLQTFYEQWHTVSLDAATSLDNFSTYEAKANIASIELSATLKAQAEEFQKISEAIANANTALDSFLESPESITFQAIQQLKTDLMEAGLLAQDFQSYLDTIMNADSTEGERNAATYKVKEALALQELYNAYSQAKPYMTTAIEIETYLVNGKPTNSPIQDQYDTDVGVDFTQGAGLGETEAAIVEDALSEGDENGIDGTATYSVGFVPDTSGEGLVFEADGKGTVYKNIITDAQTGGKAVTYTVKVDDKEFDIDEDTWNKIKTLADSSGLDPITFALAYESGIQNYDGTEDQFWEEIERIVGVWEGYANDIDPLVLQWYIEQGGSKGDFSFGYAYAMDDNGNVLLDENNNPILARDENGNPIIDFGKITFRYDLEAAEDVETPQGALYAFVDADNDGTIDEDEELFLEYTYRLKRKPILVDENGDPDDPNNWRKMLKDKNGDPDDPNNWLTDNTGNYVYQYEIDWGEFDPNAPWGYNPDGTAISLFTLRWQYLCETEGTDSNHPNSFNHWGTDDDVGQTLYWTYELVKDVASQDDLPEFEGVNFDTSPAAYTQTWTAHYMQEGSLVDTLVNSALSSDYFGDLEVGSDEYNAQRAELITYIMTKVGKNTEILNNENDLMTLLGGDEWFKAADNLYDLEVDLRLRTTQAEADFEAFQEQHGTLFLDVEFPESKGLEAFGQIYGREDHNSEAAKRDLFSLIDLLPDQLIWGMGFATHDELKNVWGNEGPEHLYMLLGRALMNDAQTTQYASHLGVTYTASSTGVTNNGQLSTKKGGYNASEVIVGNQLQQLSALINAGDWKGAWALFRTIDSSIINDPELLKYYYIAGGQIVDLLNSRGLESTAASVISTLRGGKNANEYLVGEEWESRFRLADAPKGGEEISPISGEEWTAKKGNNAESVDSAEFVTATITPRTKGHTSLVMDAAHVQFGKGLTRFFKVESYSTPLHTPKVNKPIEAGLTGYTFAPGASYYDRGDPQEVGIVGNKYQSYVVPWGQQEYGTGMGGIGHIGSTDQMVYRYIWTNKGLVVYYDTTADDNRGEYRDRRSGIYLSANPNLFKNYVNRDNGTFLRTEQLGTSVNTNVTETGTVNKGNGQYDVSITLSAVPMYNQSTLTSMVDWMSELITTSSAEWNSEQIELANMVKHGMKSYHTPETSDDQMQDFIEGGIVGPLIMLLSSTTREANPALYAQGEQIAYWLLEGLLGPMDSWAGQVHQKLNDLGLGDSLYADLCAIFGIRSPSTLTQTVGMWIMAGLQKGIDDNAKIDLSKVASETLAAFSKLEQELLKGIGNMHFYDILQAALTSMGYDIKLTKPENGTPGSLNSETGFSELGPLMQAAHYNKLAKTANITNSEQPIATGAEGKSTFLTKYANVIADPAEHGATLNLLQLNIDDYIFSESKNAYVRKDNENRLFSDDMFDAYGEYMAQVTEDQIALSTNGGEILAQAALELLFTKDQPYHYSVNEAIDPAVRAAMDATFRSMESSGKYGHLIVNGEIVNDKESDFYTAFWAEYEQAGVAALNKVQAAWDGLKQLWFSSIDEYYQEQQKAAEKVLAVWESTFKTIAKLQADLDPGESIKDVLADDTANWIKMQKAQGKTYQQMVSEYYTTGTTGGVDFNPATMSTTAWANKTLAVGKNVGIAVDAYGIPILQTREDANALIRKHYDTDEYRNQIAEAMGSSVQTMYDSYNLALATGNTEQAMIWKFALDSFFNTQGENGPLTKNAQGNYVLAPGADGSITIPNSTELVNEVFGMFINGIQFQTDEEFDAAVQGYMGQWFTQNNAFYKAYLADENRVISNNDANIAILTKAAQGKELTQKEQEQLDLIMSNTEYAGLSYIDIIKKMREEQDAAQTTITQTETALGYGWQLIPDGKGGTYWGNPAVAASESVINTKIQKDREAALQYYEMISGRDRTTLGTYSVGDIGERVRYEIVELGDGTFAVNTIREQQPAKQEIPTEEPSDYYQTIQMAQDYASIYSLDKQEILDTAEILQEDEDMQGRALSDIIEIAATIERQKRAVSELTSNWDSLADSIDKTKVNGIDYTKNMRKILKLTEDFLGLDYGTLPETFLETGDNLKLMEKAIKGDADALNKLQVIAAKTVAQQNRIELNESLAKKIAEDTTLEVGDTITYTPNGDNTALATSISQMYTAAYDAAIAGGASVSQAMKIANEMMNAVGYDVKPIEMEEVTYYANGQVPDGYEPQLSGNSIVGPNGEVLKGVTWSATKGGDYTYPVKFLRPKGAGLNITRLNEGPPSGKGGGGGGGKKKPTARKKYSEIERYHEIDGSLKAIKNEMSKIEKLRERAFGPDKIKILDAELRLLQKQKEAQEVLAAEASKWLVSDQELLNSLVDGVEYLDDGRIANWSELQHQWIDEYNAAVAAADKIKDDEKKQEALDAAQKEYDRKIEALENYEESLDKVLEAGLELEDLVNQISAKLLEKIQYNVEYKMDLNESDLEIMEYYLDTFEDDVFKSAESMDNMMEQITTHLDDLKTLKEGYNELIKEYNNGAGLITDADFQAGLKEFQSQIIDTLSELHDLKKEMKEFYEDVLENASEELENHTEKLDAIVETMESYISIQELMGKGVNYEWVTGIYQTQYEANRALLTANKQYLDTLIQARDEATDPDLIEAYNDAIVEANESLLESTEAVLETLQKIYENTIASIFDTLDKSLAGTADSVEELSEDYAYYQEAQERYVSTAKELYEVSKLNRDIEKSINETASQTHKNLLKQLQERINAQSELNELTQYDLEMNQKQYDLLLAKIALEEAQNAKDTVRLVRDANGNYSYQYTADQSKIDEAEQKYEDALYAIHELSAERIKEMEQEMIDARKTFLDSAKEIAEAEYESEEERYEDLLKLFDQYKERMTYSYAEYEEATNHLGVNAQSFAELFGVSVDEIYGGSSLISEALGALFALGADATFEDAWAAIQAVMEAAREREEAVQDATDDAGTSLDDMSGNAESASGAIDGLIDEITDLNTKLGEEFIEVNKVADAWLRLHEVLSSTSFDYEQIAENMQKLQEAIGTDGLGLILGDIIINGDAMAGTQDTEDQIGYYDDDGVYHQYATGGLVDYTGPAWVDGTPDKPELMLNATDTPRFLEAIKIARQINFRRGFGDSSLGQYANIISDTLEASMAAMYDVMANSYHATDSAFRILSAIKSEPIDQNVIIDAHFPNVTNHTEIEDALSNLINQASQFTNRNF